MNGITLIPYFWLNIHTLTIHVDQDNPSLLVSVCVSSFLSVHGRSCRIRAFLYCNRAHSGLSEPGRSNLNESFYLMIFKHTAIPLKRHPPSVVQSLRTVHGSYEVIKAMQIFPSPSRLSLFYVIFIILLFGFIRTSETPLAYIFRTRLADAFNYQPLQRNSVNVWKFSKSIKTGNSSVI